MTDSHIVGAYWIAARAVNRILGQQPIAELGLTSNVFDQARRDVSTALATPPDDRRVINLLVGAEACRRCDELPAD